MNPDLAAVFYLLAACLFIVGLKRLGGPHTARSGNQLAALGMLIAVIVTLAESGAVSWWALSAGLTVGAGAGAVLARRVAMTGMPQLVAAFNGFGGGASALVATAEFLENSPLSAETGITAAFSVVIGVSTFTGSFIAFGKLAGVVTGRPLLFRGQVAGEIVLGAGLAAAAVWAIADGGAAALWVTVGLAGLLGVSRTLPIGGADMPVIVAFLNSLSGLAAAAAGFVIDSVALIIAGALVGASGLVLTNIMSRAMNRSLGNVLFGSFGTEGGQPGTAGGQPVRRAGIEDTAITLAYARSVILVPGYGLAVAQAQHAVRELADRLGERGVRVRYAIHPVAGRMPGHMNVLLAEADVPYEALLDLDEINADFGATDVALVVGANDVVNPAARDDPDSPIFGMPILEADRAATAIVIKRSLSPGFAGIDNPLFYRDSTLMLFADAKAGLEELAAAVREA